MLIALRRGGEPRGGKPRTPPRFWDGHQTDAAFRAADLASHVHTWMRSFCRTIRRFLQMGKNEKTKTARRETKPSQVCFQSAIPAEAARLRAAFPPGSTRQQRSRTGSFLCRSITETEITVIHFVEWSGGGAPNIPKQTTEAGLCVIPHSATRGALWAAP